MKIFSMNWFRKKNHYGINEWADGRIMESYDGWDYGKISLAAVIVLTAAIMIKIIKS